ncbi:MAG: endopeptidase La [Myxococcales bacterium]|nr:endopeptidase La [Myxococcales bacterium]
MFLRGKGNSGSRTIPLLPLRELVVFPHAAVSFVVGRERSIAALNEAMRGDKEIFLVTQREATTRDPTPEELHTVGTIATVVQVMRLPDATVKVLVEGLRRGRVARYTGEQEHLIVEIEEMPDPSIGAPELLGLVRQVKDSFDEYAKLNKSVTPDALSQAQGLEDPGRLSDVLVRHLALRTDQRQRLLDTASAKERLEEMLKIMLGEVDILQVEKKIKSRVKKQMERTQKEYYLNEQMQAIQKELGEKDESRSEMQELEARAAELDLSVEAKDRVERELRKLKMMSPMSAESAVVRNYLDVLLAMPWGVLTEDRLDVASARQVLDEDHHGLRKVKSRILEYLAVVALTGKPGGQILCLVGPPGVGKTSLAKSIARATDRKFVRIALGGVRDEAEIRGHRRTYIGALPGRILQGMRKAGSANPVFLLDEIDKLSADFRGDPSSALLEVLDPEQNNSFNDHYLDLDFDLSKVMFICTANDLRGIPAPLQDRLEIVRLSGYTEAEKLAIARRYLVPKQIAAHGLNPVNIRFEKDALTRVVREYTREAGVRNLERELASICRKAAVRVVKRGKDTRVRIDAAGVERVLGVPRHRRAPLGERDLIGFVNGLAWTAVGGVMVPIEAAVVRGSGKTTLTGQLGTVFRESAQAAVTYTRIRGAELGLKSDFWSTLDLHVHVPELWGVDGPSAGITIATAVVSAVCGIPVRRDVAMTGEITLRGQVRPIGGLKEKLLAAVAAGITRVLIPADNTPDLRDVPPAVRNALTIIPVETMDEVLLQSLAAAPTDIFRSPVAESEHPADGPAPSRGDDEDDEPAPLPTA